MTESCRKPIPFETLADYLSGQLAEADEQELEEHLFGCRPCALEAETLGGLLSVVSAVVPYVLSSSRFATLERAGRVETVNTMAPGQKADVVFPTSGRLLVHRLGGARLEQAQRVDVDLENTRGEAIVHLEAVPFDAARGEVLVACQAHFVDLFPRDVVFTLEVVSGTERREVARYTVLHQPRG